MISDSKFQIITLWPGTVKMDIYDKKSKSNFGD